MADDDDAPTIPYQLRPLAGGKPMNNSHGYSGPAQVQYPNGDKFAGEFLNGKKHGKGKYLYKNQDIFMGEWREDKREGLGYMNYYNKTKDMDEDEGPRERDSYYHGHFHLGMRHGEGTYVYKNGDIYSGSWKENKKHGRGRYIYSGSWKENKKHGRGRLVFGGSNFCYHGDWLEGKIVTGKWILSDRIHYEGKFENGKPSGLGKYVLAPVDGYGEEKDPEMRKWKNPGYELHGCYYQQEVPVDETTEDGGMIVKRKLEWETIVMTHAEPPPHIAMTERD